MTHQEKFKNLIRLCERAKKDGAEYLLIAWPEVLGDTYKEVVASLGSIAQAGLALRIAHPNRKVGLESSQRSGK